MDEFLDLSDLSLIDASSENILEPIDFIPFIEVDNKDKETVEITDNSSICCQNYNQSKKKKKKQHLYFLENGMKISYDPQTCDYYRILRKTGACPITGDEIEDQCAFKFPYEWDPYTGNRKTLDPYGPLHFNPDILIKHFFTTSLSKLYTEIIDTETGEKTGYYDDAVGNGPLFDVNSRGEHPEWYLFRLPITDCYLTKDHNHMLITLGPELTGTDITMINNLAIKMGNTYVESFGCQRPNLIDMFKYYQVAIDPYPSIEFHEDYNSDMTKEKKDELRMRLNREAVDNLRRMRG